MPPIRSSLISLAFFFLSSKIFEKFQKVIYWKFFGIQSEIFFFKNFRNLCLKLV